MEMIKESGLEILKGKNIVSVMDRRGNPEIFFKFVDELLEKNYKVLSFQLQQQNWKCVLSCPN
jgi:hypothetical protein